MENFFGKLFFLSNFYLKVQGDDSLVLFPQKRFNAVLSEKKTTIGSSIDNISVLSYGHDNSVAKRTDLDLLSHLYYPERNTLITTLPSTSVGIAQASMGYSQLACFFSGLSGGFLEVGGGL